MARAEAAGKQRDDLRDEINRDTGLVQKLHVALSAARTECATLRGLLEKARAYIACVNADTPRGQDDDRDEVLCAIEALAMTKDATTAECANLRGLLAECRQFVGTRSSYLLGEKIDALIAKPQDAAPAEVKPCIYCDGKGWYVERMAVPLGSSAKVQCAFCFGTGRVTP